MARILSVGIATLDVIHWLDNFPAEDSEQRATAQVMSRGGNATNTLVVLSQLGHQASWAGALTDDTAADTIIADLQRHSISMQYCEKIAGGATPVSLILINSQTGSRTISHYRDLPEYSLQAFKQIDLADYDWLHVEGRDVEQLALILAHARNSSASLHISLELEKPRDHIESLIPFADVVLCSSVYARHHGFQNADECVMALHRQFPDTEFCCAWGEQGASSIQTDASLHHVDALRLEKVVDTRAAGDVFNAAYIHAYLQGQFAQARLQYAVELASHKCTRMGIDNLV